MQPSCLLWDVDGTLIDTTALIAESLDMVYRRFYGRTLPPERLRALIGTPLKDQVRIFGDPETFGVSAATVMQAFIHHYETNRHRERILTDVTQLLIAGKRAGIPTGLVTSKNQQELANSLPRLGIADYIDVAITADDVTRPKPDPEGIQMALHRLQIPQAQWPQVVYIGDTVHDMRAAHAAGVRPVAVLWGAGPPELLAAQNPERLCATPQELKAYLFPPQIE
ncbi:MAG: HAD family hydrolase [Chloroherpetonaceae bacterium]|nr:HAD family hydrolase [Chthonomonadaceae bacterium]MDW8208689.1 HAD family hydrolase [Chloroherpetonaceae bacterium]